MMPAKIHAWPTQVYLCSGLHDKGVDIIYEQLVAFQEHATQNGHLIIKRNNQELYWLHQTVKDCLNDRFYNNPKVQKQVSLLEQQVLDKVKSPFEAAQELLDLVKN
jgi:LAO/AO transport system kinase